MTSDHAAWVSADEATRLLGVTRATLYAYVSRGFLRSQTSAASPRERRYALDDLHRLRRRTEERRAPELAAARTLQWGLPILESAITLIDGRRLFYRGFDAIELARTRSLIEVASLMWTGDFEKARPEAGARPAARNVPRLPFIARAETMLAAAAGADAAALDLRPTAVPRAGFRALALLTQAAIGRPPATTAIDRALARAWRVGNRGVGVINAALVVCADHELNVSSFTARCVASAGSHPYAVLIAGLAALEGPRHGGAAARVASMLRDVNASRSIRSALADRLRRGDRIDGFGHPLYRAGDPRAQLLLGLLGERYSSSTRYRFVMQAARAGSAITGEHPNLDFGLAAVAYVLNLEADAPLILFAIGRSVGWIGHAIEQYATDHIIRPRAKYVGVAPRSVLPV